MLTYFKRLRKSQQRIFAFIVGIGIILVWRGIWGLGDMYLFPNNQLYSLISSIIIGVIILLASHRLVKGLI